MLKQILATSALIAIAAVSIQSASAADGNKFRQLVVEPSGTPGGDADLLLKKKVEQRGLVRIGSGLATAGGSGNGNGGAGQAKFIVAPSQGIPTGNGGGAGNGNGRSGQPAQFIVASGQGIPTGSGGGNGNGNGGGARKNLPQIAALPGGIPTPIKVVDNGGD